MADFFTIFIKNCHPVSCKIYVSLLINGHPIRPHFTKQFSLSQLSVLSYFVNISLVVPYICHIQQIFLRMSYDTIGLDQTIIYSNESFRFGMKIIYIFSIALHFCVSITIISFVQGTRQIHSSIRTHPHIIGAIEEIPFFTAEYNRMISIFIKFPQLIVHILTGNQVPIHIKIQSVGSATLVSEDRELSTG